MFKLKNEALALLGTHFASEAKSRKRTSEVHLELYATYMLRAKHLEGDVIREQISAVIVERFPAMARKQYAMDVKETSVSKLMYCTGQESLSDYGDARFKEWSKTDTAEKSPTYLIEQYNELLAEWLTDNNLTVFPKGKMLNVRTQKGWRRYWHQQVGDGLGKIKKALEKFENPTKPASKSEVALEAETLQGEINMDAVSDKQAEKLLKKITEVIAYAKDLALSDTVTKQGMALLALVTNEVSDKDISEPKEKQKGPRATNPHEKH